MNEKALIFRCDGDSLLGILHPGSGVREVGVLIVVGGPQYRVGSHRQFVVMARRLAKEGYDVLRFDYRGMGDSEGPFAGFERCDADIRAAVDAFLAERPHLRSVVLFGLCDGASAALMYAPDDQRVSGLILANPWARTESTQAATMLRHYYVRRLLDPNFWTKLLKGGLEIRKSLAGFGENVQNARSSKSRTVTYIARMQQALTRFTGEVLLILSGDDLTAREFADLFDKSPDWSRARRNRRIARVELPAADHTFSVSSLHREMLDQLLQWLGGALGSDIESVRAAGGGR